MTFYIRTYGCQMNERDSEALSVLLETHGYTRAESENSADIILFNTCSVRDQAERKVFGKVGLLSKMKKSRPDLILGILGCMAQNYSSELLKSCPEVDLVVGTDRVQMLPEILQEVQAGRRGVVYTEPGLDVLGALQHHVPGQISAFVSVMRGCNQFCSYCIVPYVRGREKSRTVDDIVAEVSGLAEAGTREIFLLGQNITAYGLAEARQNGTYNSEISPFADLLRAVHEVPGIGRIRFTSPHPKYMNGKFIETVCSLPKVCDHFHIPLQSGCDRILKLMQRGYTAEAYRRLIAEIKSRLTEVTFSTDVIIGFPGETDAEFEQTRQLMQDVEFDMAYIFRYSPRTGTVAAEKFTDDVPDEVKRERNQILLRDLEKRAQAKNRSLIGRTLEVLVEGPSKRNQARWTGRTRQNKVCIFTAAPAIVPGDLIQVEIQRTTANAIYGNVITVDGGDPASSVLG